MKHKYSNIACISFAAVYILLSALVIVKITKELTQSACELKAPSYEQM